LLHLTLGWLWVVPEARVARLLLHFSYCGLFTSQVKDAPPPIRFFEATLSGPVLVVPFFNPYKFGGGINIV
jgi:hypothetical protein